MRENLDFFSSFFLTLEFFVTLEFFFNSLAFVCFVCLSFVCTLENTRTLSN